MKLLFVIESIKTLSCSKREMYRQLIEDLSKTHEVFEQYDEKKILFKRCIFNHY